MHAQLVVAAHVAPARAAGRALGTWHLALGTALSAAAGRQWPGGERDGPDGGRVDVHVLRGRAGLTIYVLASYLIHISHHKHHHHRSPSSSLINLFSWSWYVFAIIDRPARVSMHACRRKSSGMEISRKQAAGRRHHAWRPRRPAAAAAARPGLSLEARRAPRKAGRSLTLTLTHMAITCMDTAGTTPARVVCSRTGIGNEHMHDELALIWCIMSTSRTRLGVTARRAVCGEGTASSRKVALPPPRYVYFLVEAESYHLCIFLLVFLARGDVLVFIGTYYSD